MLHKRYDQGRGRFEHGNLAIANPAIQTAKINPVVFRTNNHRAAVIERPRDIPDEDVEGETCQLQQTYRKLVQTVIPAVGRGCVYQTVMLDHDPFWTSRCPGGVDYIRQILRFVDRLDIGGVPDVQRLIVQRQYGMQTQVRYGFGCCFAVRWRICCSIQGSMEST
ncbi:hypothetical protein D3C74_307250 [compost metagenome]